MSTSEIITKAVRKAIKNGYGHYDPKDRDESTKSFRLSVTYNWAGSISIKDFAESDALIYSEQMSLFNHNFAKALWGEQNYDKTDIDISALHLLKRIKYSPAWQIHLMQMVIANDPIEYLRENI